MADDLSVANRTAIAMLVRLMEQRLLAAQRSGENGDVEIHVTLALLRGQARGIRWRPDERLTIGSGSV